MKFMLDCSVLKKGDIILSRMPRDEKIRNSLNTNYMHASLFVGGQTLLHANPPGVFSRTIERFLLDNPEDFLVMRCKNILPDDKIDRICELARMRVSTLYPKKEVIEFFKTRKIFEYDGREVCTTYVAKCYADAGYSIVECEDSFTPNVFENSPLLTIVTNAVIEADDRILHINELENQVKVSQDRYFEWLEKARKLILEKVQVDIINEDQVYDFLIGYPQYDDEILSYIIDSKFAETYKLDLSINPTRYSFELLLSYNPTITYLNFYVEQELRANTSIIEIYKKNAKSLLGFYSRTGVKTFKYLSKIYIGNLKQILQSLKIDLQIAKHINNKQHEDEVNKRINVVSRYLSTCQQGNL